MTSTATPDAPPELPATQPGPNLRPALLVLALAALIIVVGIVASALDSGANPTFDLHSMRLADGTVVPLTAGNIALHRLSSNGEPPADVINVIGIPSGAKLTHVNSIDQGVDQFDRVASFTTALTQDQTVELFRRSLHALGWQIIYVGGATQNAGATEVLAKKGSGDGFYWESGVTVSPTTSSGYTPFTFELLQLPDDN